jgi:hypothetical protein
VASPAAVGALDENALPWVAPDLTGPVQVLPPVLPAQRLSGAVFVGYRGSDGQTTGSVLTVAPFWRSFLRVGAEVTPRSKRGDVRLLWGLGVEDRRDRSFFLHVHDWGPVRLGEAFTVRQSEVAAGYKLPTLGSGRVRLATRVLATVPFAGGPWVGARATVALGTWFASAGLARVVPGVLERAGAPPWRVSFGLGRWDSKPGTLFLTYRDEMRLDRLRAWGASDRQEQGVLAAGVNWSY